MFACSAMIRSEYEYEYNYMDEYCTCCRHHHYCYVHSVRKGGAIDERCESIAIKNFIKNMNLLFLLTDSLESEIDLNCDTKCKLLGQAAKRASDVLICRCIVNSTIDSSLAVNLRVAHANKYDTTNCIYYFKLIVASRSFKIPVAK